MAYSDKSLLRDKNGLPIPQLWDSVLGDFTPLTSLSSQQQQLVAAQPFNGSANMTVTFTTSMQGIVISNDSSAASLSFTIGSDTYTVHAGEVFEENFLPFTTVSITASDAFRGYGLMPTVAQTVTPSPPADTTTPTVSASPAAGTYSATQSVTLTGNDSDGDSVTIYYTLDGTTPTSSSTRYTGAISISSTTTIKYIAVDTNSISSSVQTATYTIVTVPANVTNLATSGIASTSLTLSWTASSGATSYDVFQGSTLLGNTASTSYNATGLSASTAYTFTVKAKNSAGSASGASVNATTAAPPANPAPNDVTNLTNTAVTQTGATLNWTASTSNTVTGYYIYNGTTLLGNVASNVTTYNATGLTANTAYTLTVKAYDGSQYSTGVSTSFTTLINAPADVTNLAASSITQTSLTLGWTASPTATSYDVYNGATLLGNTASTSYNVTSLTAGTQYTFKVVAKNAGGSSSGATVTATTTAAASAPADVTNLAAGSVTSDTLTLSWTASATATSYDVYNGATLLGNTATTTYNVSSLTESTAYTFKVIAKNANGSSAGVTVSATTLAVQPVTGLTVGTVTSSSIPLSWTLSTSTNVEYYEVAYSTDGTNFTVSSGQVNASSTSYTITGLTALTAYTVRVVTIDTNNNRSTGVTKTATTSASAPTYVVNDTFTDTDGTNLTAHVPDVSPSGNKWTAVTGGWSITGNQASVSSNVTDNVAVINSGKSDCTVQVTLATNSTGLTNARVIFRETDANNLFIVQNAGAYYQMFKKASGTYSQVGSNSTGVTPSNGDVIKIVLSGSSIIVSVNGTQIFSPTDSFNQTATNHGLGANGSTSTSIRWDNFTVA